MTKFVSVEFGVDSLTGESGVMVGTAKVRMVQRCECGGSTRTHCLECEAPLCIECVDVYGLCDVCTQAVVQPTSADYDDYAVN